MTFSKFIPQPEGENANKHTQRGMTALEASVETGGLIGAITAADNGEVFDGSARTEVLNQKFGDAPTIELDVDEYARTQFGGTLPEQGYSFAFRTDGSVPVIHVRSDIPDSKDPTARYLAIAANRTAELNLSWDTEVLEQEAEELDLSPFWRETEIELEKSKGAQIGFTDEDGMQPLDFGEFNAPDTLPLTIILSSDDLDRWNQFKDGVGIQNNTRALLKLLEDGGY